MTCHYHNFFIFVNTNVKSWALHSQMNLLIIMFLQTYMSYHIHLTLCGGKNAFFRPGAVRKGRKWTFNVVPYHIHNPWNFKGNTESCLFIVNICIFQWSYSVLNVNIPVYSMFSSQRALKTCWRGKIRFLDSTPAHSTDPLTAMLVNRVHSWLAATPI